MDLLVVSSKLRSTGKFYFGQGMKWGDRA